MIPTQLVSNSTTISEAMMGKVSRERLAAFQVKGGGVIQVAIKGGKIPHEQGLEMGRRKE